MAGTPGIAAKVFGALAGAGVNVRAIAQGSSERNISVVIDERQITRALRAVHARVLPVAAHVSIGVIGSGRGRQRAARAALRRRRRGCWRDFNLDLRVRGADDVEAHAAGRSGRSLDGLARRARPRRRPGPGDVRRARQRGSPAARRDHRLHGERRRGRAVSALAGRRHPRRHAEQAGQQRSAGAVRRAAARRGAAAARTTCTRRRSARACRSSRRCATCARPATRSAQVEGIFSGTLAYLFNVWDGTQPFSAIVRDAKAKGYTEPDPRDDLSGTDVGPQAGHPRRARWACSSSCRTWRSKA